MSLNTRIRKYLDDAEQTHKKAGLEQAYALLVENGRATAATVTPVFNPDMYVLCAEVAVKLGQFDIAEKCLDSYDDTNPRKNQFMCRAFFARCQVQAFHARRWKGATLREALLAALETLMKGHRIARSDPMYNFLIYNASVVYTQVSRPLQVKGFRRHLYPYQSEISSALEELDDTDYAWRVELLIGLAWCYADADKPAEAQKAAADAETLANKFVPELKPRILGLQVDLSKDTPASLAKAKAGAGNNAHLKVLYHTLAIKSGAVKPEAVEAELKEAVRAAGVDYAQLLAGEDDATDGGRAGGKSKAASGGKAAGGKDSGKAAKDAPVSEEEDIGELLAPIGVSAALVGLDELAEACAKKAILSKSLGARVRAEYAQAVLLIGSLGPSSNKLTKSMVSIRAAALKGMEKALESGVRTRDSVLIEDMCISTWNMALPLLQDNLRKHTARVLQRVLVSLDHISSQLDQLRSQVLLELAHCDVKDDFLSKAVDRVEAAVRLDYAVDESESERMDMARPLDRFLFPMREKLSLKTQIHRDAKTRDEEALLLLEQAREARDPQLAATFIQKAADALDADPLPIDDDDDTPVEYDDDIPAAVLEPSRRRCRLWIDIALQAWKCRLRVLTRRAATNALSEVYTGPADKDLTVLQAQVYFIEAESCIAELRANGNGLHIPEDPENSVPIDEITPGMPNSTDPATLKARAVRGFLEGITLGLNLDETWLVLNGVIYIWNYLQPAIAAGECQPFLNTLGKCYQALSELENPDIPLMCAITDALSQAMIAESENPSDQSQGGDGSATEPGAATKKKGKDTKAAAPEKGKGGKGGKGATAKGASAAPETREPANLNWQCPRDGQTILKLGLESCDYVIERAKPMQKKNVLRSRARLEKALKQTPVPKGDPESQVIIMIESLANESTPAATRTTTLQNAINLLADGKRNPELYTRLAHYALALDNHELSRQCHERALPDKVNMDSDAKLYKPDVWRWIALECLLWGRSLLSQLYPEKQEKVYQDHLRKTAMAQFQVASRCGRHAQRFDVVLSAAGLFWNTCGPFLKSAATRVGLRPMLESLLSDVSTWEIDDDMVVAGYMFQALLDCIQDADDYKAGLKAFDRAASVLPSTMMAPLWEYRVVFLGRAGKNVIADMFKMKESSTKQVQAKVWLTLARNATTSLDQLGAFQNAVDTLTAQASLQVDVLTEYALWLYCNEFPVEDARDALFTAIDHLQVIDDNAADLPDAAPSVASRRSRHAGSVRSKLSRMLSSRPTSGGKSSTRGSGRESTSSAGRRDQAAFASKLEQRSVVMFEKLVRLNVLCAHLAADANSVAQHALAAADYAIRLWEHMDSFARRTLAVGEDGEKKEEEPSTLPTTLADWVTYTVPENIISVCESDTSPNSVNAVSLERPDEFMHYTSTLVRMLETTGLHLHAFPVIKLSLLAARVAVPDSKPLTSLLNLRCGQLCEAVGAIDTAKSHWALAGDLSLSSEDRAKYGELLKARAAEKKASKGPSPRSLSPRREHYLRPVHIRDIWTGQARFAIEHGQLLVAAELLAEAREHGSAFEDTDTIAACLILQAKIAFQHGQTTEAINLVKASREYPVSVELYREGAADLFHYYLEQDLTAKAHAMLNESLDFLRNTQAAFVNQSLEVDRACAQLLLEKGLVATKEVKAMELANPAARSVSTIETGSSALRESCDLLRQRGLACERSTSFHAYTDLVLSSLPRDANDRYDTLRALFAQLAKANDELSEYFEDLVDIPRSCPYQLPIQRVQMDGRELAGVIGYHLAEDLYTQPALMKKESEVPDFPGGQGASDEVIKQFLVPDAEDLLAEPRNYLQTALVHLTACQNLTTTPARNARALLHLGACLRRLERTMPDSVDPWGKESEEAKPEASPEEPPSARTDATKADDENGGEGKPEPKPTVRQSTAGYLMHAVSVLEKGLDLAREHDLSEIAVTCAIELVEAFGSRQPDVCAKYIALAQAYAFQSDGRQLVNDAAHANDPDRLFMRRLDYLESLHPYTDACPQLSGDRDYLTSHSASWRRTSVPKSFQTVLDAFPDNADVLVTHWHPRNLTMYVALFAHDSEGRAPKSHVLKFPVEATVVPTIRDNYTKLRKALNRHIIHVYEDQPSTLHVEVPKADKKGGKDKKPDKSKGKGGGKKDSSSAAAQDAAGSDDEAAIEQRTDDLSDDLTDLIDQSEFFFRPVQDLVASLNPAVEAADENDTSGSGSRASELSLVVSASMSLSPVIWEGLSFAKQYKGVVRDFSLALFAHRATWVDEKGVTASASRAKFGYIVDPRHDAVHENSDESTLAAAFEQDVLKGKSFVKDWFGMLGSQNMPSTSDWQRALHGRSGFIFLGHCSLLSQVEPASIAGLDLLGCNLVFNLGLCSNEKSSRRQSKIDTSKSNARLALEGSARTVALLSICGVNAVVTNQWAAHEQANHRVLAMMLAKLEDGATLAEVSAVRGAVFTREWENYVQFNPAIYGLPHLKLSA